MKHKHPWWHYFFTRLKTISTFRPMFEESRTYYTYVCSRCKVTWEKSDPENDYKKVD